MAVVVSRPASVQAVEPAEPSVWLANGNSGTPMYGRVNSLIMELDEALPTLASFPTSILQYGSDAVLVAGSKYLTVNSANPVEIDEETALGSLPGTIQTIATSGPYVVLLDDTGRVFGASLGDVAAGHFGSAINTTSQEGPAPVTERFLAAAVTSAGLIYAFGSDGQLVTYDITTGTETSRQKYDGLIPTGTSANLTYSITEFAGNWALLRQDTAAAAASLWIDGVAVASPPDATAQLASPTPASVLYVATSTGLRSYRPDASVGAVAVSVAGGQPARPVVDSNSCVHAAWASAGIVMTSYCGEAAVSHTDDATATDQSTLTFRGSSEAFVLNDSSTGAAWVWRNRSWEFVSSSAQWDQVQSATRVDPNRQSEPVKDNRCPVPATGADAEFGLRGDTLTRVPVLIAARDANEGDVLSIVPGSVAWKGAPLGELSIVDDGQALAVSVTGTPTATSTIKFEVTDGTCAQAAIATVRVHPDTENEKPELRGETWSARDLTLDPQASLTVDALRGWVDPDGDPLVVTADPASVGTAVASPTGTVVYRPESAQSAKTAKVEFTVSDPAGLTASSELDYTLAAGADPHVGSFATTAVVGRTQVISVAPHISGTAGALAITDVPDVAGLTITRLSDATSLAVTARLPGSYTIDYEATSGTASGRGKIRFEAVAADEAVLSTAPITVYLFAGDDVGVDPLTAVRNPAGDVLAITGISVDSATDSTEGSISVSSVEGTSLRIAAQGPDGKTGVAGTFSYTVTSQTSQGKGQTVTGRGTVYLIADQGQQDAVARDDYAVVRAGSTIDLDVLANDVAPAGTALVLDPRDRHDDDLTQGLGFPSGSTLRFLAPTTPGLVPVTYSVYTRGHPDAVSQATAYFQVTASDANGAPQSQTVTGRVFSGGYVDLSVSQFNADPDGDEVYAIDVQQPAAGGEAQILDSGATLRVTALGSYTGQSIEFTYTVSDGRTTGEGTARVAVVDGSQAPVAFNDYVFGAVGSSMSLDPTLNDTIPAGQVAALSVDRLETSGQGTTRVPVEVKSGTTALTLEVDDTPAVYEYTIETSTAADTVTGAAANAGQRRVVGTASARIRVTPATSSVPTFPRITDTVVTAADVKAGTFSVDVVTGKVAWAGSALSLALVGSPGGAAAVSNTAVSGKLLDTAQVIPFSLAQATATGGGDAVISYGFIRVPALSAFRPVRVDPSKTFTATEGDPAGVTIDLAAEVTAFQGASIEIVGSPRSDGLRRNGTCTRSSASTVVYVAGAGAETRDGCSVTVQWSGNPASRTVLRFGIKIALLNPPPQLSSGVIIMKLAPRQTEAYSLTKLVSWERKSAADIAGLEFRCAAADGTQILVSCNGGSILTATAQPKARQGGNPDVITVTIVGPDTFSPAVTATVLIQVIQPDPVTLQVPTITRQLEANGAQSGAVTEIIDVLAEIRPVLDTYYGWHSGSINTIRCSAPVTCTAAGPARIEVSIPAQVGGQPTPGGTFRGSYTFQDSTDPAFRANQGTGELVFEYSGIPQTPTISLKSYSDSDVVVTVSAPQATPAVTDVLVRGTGGLQATCKPTGGTCNARFAGLTPNERHTFTAVSRNAVGDSVESSPVEAWAYRAPEKPSVTWVPVANGASGQKTRLLVTANGANTESFTVTVAGTDATKTVSGGKANFELSGISNVSESVTVTANSDTPRPDANATRDTASTNVTVNGVGAPTVLSVDQVPGERRAVAKVKGNGTGSSVAVGWSLGDNCTVSNVVSGSGIVEVTSPTYSASDIPQNTSRTVKFCAESRVASMSGMAGVDSSVTGLDNGDAFGREVSTATILVIEAPSETAVRAKVRFDVQGSVTEGFAVTLPSTATWGSVTFGVERVGATDPSSTDPTVAINLTKDGAIVGTYTVGPLRPDRSYVPGTLNTHGFAGKDLTGCLYNDTGTGDATSVFTFDAPTFDGAQPDAADWTWSMVGLAPIANLNFTSADGATQAWSPNSIFTGGRIRLTMQFQGQLAGLSGYTHTLDPFDCAVPG